MVKPTKKSEGAVNALLKVEEMHSDAKGPSREILEQIAAIGIDSRTYHNRKRALIRMEEDNCSTIILQKRSGAGSWFEMADNSALIYYYYVLQPLKIKGVNFAADYDSFYDQYRIGKIATSSVDAIRNRVMKVGLYDREYVMDDRVHIILKRPFRKDQIEALEKKEFKRRMEMNKTLEVNHNNPLFYRDLANAMIQLHIICFSDMSKSASATNGARIINLIDGIMRTYLHSADLPEKAVDERVEDWIKIRSDVHQLKYEIQILDVVKIWAPERCLKFYEISLELIKQANRSLGEVLKEQRDKK